MNNNMATIAYPLRLSLLILTFMVDLPSASLASETRSLVADGTEITFDVYPAKGNSLYIWLPSEAGFQSAQRNTALALSEQGIEVWLVDLFEAHFLPGVESSLDRIPATDVSILIEHALQLGKEIFLVTSGRGTLPLLRGANHWQQSHPTRPGVTGVILLSPKFYLETPDPGQPARLMPIVSQTNLAVFILQPRQSPWFWKLDQTLPALAQSGSEVFVRYLPGVRDRFYFRPDASREEMDMTRRLADLMQQANRLLAQLPQKPRQVAKSRQTTPPLAEGKKERGLKPYQGDPVPPPLILHDLNNQQLNLADFQGNVVLVNFWASWCPPCVHEMPSMQRLNDNLAHQPFTILAVNMAEDRDIIQQFLKTKVDVRFPILLDSDGAALKRWGVFAFPTSYVIDKQGEIRYALFGSVEWDTSEMLTKFNSLLNE